MSHPDSQTDPLVGLAEEFAERYRRGERPSPVEYADRYPEHAERIRRLFPALVAMERLDPAEGIETGPIGGASTDCQDRPERLGDYRILRELGRGGMGVVYEAEQISLGRRVALKVLPRQALGDGRALARFLREARSAAGLHHTNIVPVFEVGRQGEDCYYAMQYIHGQGLDQVIVELRRLGQLPAEARGEPPGSTKGPAGPSPAGAEWEEAPGRVARSLASGEFAAGQPESQTPPSDHTAVLGSGSASLPGGAPLSGFEQGRRQAYFLGVTRIIHQAAGALAHAHARGVVHRDIKPSNLLLDTAGVVWLADFGLAKAEQDGLTGTGDVLGTLRYMAPERFRGEGDSRADLYALGLTLYELLTLRPAYDSPDRLKLIETIQGREPPRPRAVDPRVPRDLETIVLKATDKDPRRRYQTADEMAEDLRRFLDGEPIRARPVSSLGRAALWARRRPAEAALAVVGGLAALVTVGMAVSLWYGDHLRASLYLQRIATAGLAWRDGNFGRLEQLLDSCPEGYRGLWEWRYLKRQCPPEQLLLPGHGGGVYHLAYSPDGTRIASACLGGTVELWDATAGRRIFARPAHAGDALGVAFSPDGQQFVTTGGDGTVVVWDASTSQESRLAGPGPLPIWDVAFSPDGARFATAESGGVLRLWDTKTGRGEALPGPATRTGDVFQVAFSPDGRTLAFGGTDQAVTLWDLEAGREAGTLGEPAGHTEGTLGLAFRPGDGRLLAETGTNGMVRLWDVDEQRLIREYPGHVGDVYGVAFSPDGGWIATASGDPGVKVWDADSGEELLGLTGHAATVFDVAFRPDGGRLATASQDRTVRVWDPSADPTARVLRGHSGPVNAVAFHPGGDLLASAGEDGTVRLRDARGGPPHVLTGHDGPVISLAFRPDGGLLATADKRGAVWVWDDLLSARPSGRPLVRLDGEVSGLAFYPDGSLLATAGADGSVRSWDVGTGALKGTHAGHLSSAKGLAIGAGGRILATGGEDRTVILRDASTGRALHPPLQGHACWVYAVAFAPDGRSLSSAGGPDPNAPVASRVASVSGDGEVRIWDVASGRTLLAIHGHGNFVRGVAFHPDGSRIATAGMDRAVKLWDASTGEEVLTLRGHAAGVLGLAFSPDGTRLASAGADGTVRVWDSGR